MAQCARCRKNLGILETPPMCARCNAFLPSALAAFDRRVEWAIADRNLTLERETDLRAYQSQLGLSDWDVAGVIPKIQRARALTAINRGELPTVAPGNVMLPRGEVCHFISAASLYQEQYDRQYVSHGGRSGVRWHGISVGSRSHVGQWVQTAETVCVASGTFLVTNENVRFVSHALATIPLAKIIGFNWYWNAIELQYDGREAKDFYMINDGEWAASVVVAARRALEGPETPYR